MKRQLSMFCTFLAFASAAPLVVAQSGVIELNADCATAGCVTGDLPGFPISISQPGSYKLTSDLRVNALDGVAIAFAPTSGVVELDMGGHALNGPLTCPGPPTACSPVSGSVSYGLVVEARQIRVRNGRVEGFAVGLGIGTVEGATVEDLVIAGNRVDGINTGLGDGSDLALRNVKMLRNGIGINAAFGAGFPRLRLEQVTVARSYGDGARVSAFTTVLDSSFEGNVGFAINHNFGSAEVASGRSTYVRNNGGGANNQLNGSVRYNLGNNFCSSPSCF